MEGVFTLGQILEDTKEIIEMIKSMAWVLMFGLMVENILVNGKAIKGMVEENTL
jgi:hypothetical protein